MLRRAPPAAALSLLAAWLLPGPSAAYEFFDDRLQIHGYTEFTFRAISDDYQTNFWYPSQWANVLNLEIEASIAPNGFGPFDLIDAFARIEVRFECAFSGCSIWNSHQFFGDRAWRAPARNWADGKTSGFSGPVRVNPSVAIHDHQQRLLTFPSSPLLAELRELGSVGLEETLRPVEDDEFLFKRFEGSAGPGTFILGPWHPRSRIRPNKALETVPSTVLPLPFRPAVPNHSSETNGPRGLFIPSAAVKQRLDDHVYGDFDQNFTENELAWNHGAGQDERELKELYFDVEMFDGALWVRVGKQNIVWGKTELFRTTDQFNPQDIALESLPSLEESRIALWSLRAVYSLYDVGPLEDVRLEAAVNYDDFEPTDLGRCGEPYTVWLVCNKTFGLWAHGVLGVGLAGERRPPDPWDSVQGLEGGLRLEFRYDRFSFALSDFWGYNDNPTVDFFAEYGRSVDPDSGRPLDSTGRPLVPERALAFQPGNRQIFDFICGVTRGLAGELIAGLGDRCVPDLLNDQTPIQGPFTPAFVLTQVLAGRPLGEGFLGILAGTGPVPLPNLVRDPNDAPPAAPSTLLSALLTNPQEALIGCGEFYRTDCDNDGIDVMNAEASVLFQAFPQAVPGAPIGTRFKNGKLVMLPGSRGPGDPGYDVNVDGSPPPGFHSEMQALSSNFLTLLATLGDAGDDDLCNPADPISCSIVRAVFAVVGQSRPELRAGGNGRFGRADFLWHGGSELELFYDKRNVLGFATDFAEDRTKTNWSFELTWVDDDLFANSEALRGFDDMDVYSLTISVDRPTFVNFLNPQRTLFFNSQWFIRYLSNYDNAFSANGPFSVLGTVSVFTGYFQDRLLPSLTLVHDFSSASGGVIGQITYRITESFSVSFGAAGFYGGPEKGRGAFRQVLPPGNPGSYRNRTDFQGLSPIAERDELFMSVRATF